MKQMCKRHGDKGFTLVELLIVVVIIGILAAVVIPSVTGAIDKARISEGVQNARNITLKLTEEILFDETLSIDEEEIKNFAAKHGWDITSTVDGYAYAFDPDTNSVKFEKIASTVSGSSKLNGAYAAIDWSGRSRISQIFPGYKNYIYIDQRQDDIGEIVNTINHLVEIAKGNIQGNVKTDIVRQMNTIINNLKAKLDNLTWLDEATKTALNEFLETFRPSKMAYLASDGFYTSVSAENGVITVGRIMIVLGREEDFVDFSNNDSSDSNSYKTETDITVPSKVGFIGRNILEKLQGKLVMGSGTGIDEDAANENTNLQIERKSSIENITYTDITAKAFDKLKYEKKQINFTTGYSVTVDMDSEIYFWNYQVNNAEGKSAILVVEKKNDGTYSLVSRKDGDNFVYSSLYGDHRVNTAITFASENVVANAESATDAGKHYIYSNGLGGYNYVLSETALPTLSLSFEDLGLDLLDFADGLNMVGKLSMRSNILPGAIEYKAVAVDKKNQGYRIDNIGYLTDIVLSVKQLNAEGRICVAEENGGNWTIKNAVNEANVTISLPEAAKNFINFNSDKIKIEYGYKYSYVEHTLASGMTQKIAIPTGRVFYSETTSTGTITSGFNNGSVSFKISNIGNNNISFDTNSTAAANQIKITYIKISYVDGGNTTTLFLRNFY